MEDPRKGEPVTACIYVYKEKMQSDGGLNKFKLIIFAIGALQHKEMIRYTWSPTASMRTLKYFLADSPK